eukprot:TRINITY_DN65089_c0_g1_i3.p1 TRINITY_DN65089_c0_g1~~TRINITY_DN65089_c0_g1_i3.p1  ORF type:complete len:2922 (-),score=1604.51 TRINITY_DN65089_c0_g1_i3:340-9066(-)
MTVQDIVPPHFTKLFNKTINVTCEDPIVQGLTSPDDCPWHPACSLPIPEIEDNCSNAPDLELFQDIDMGDNCTDSYIMYNNWRAKDPCGNVNWFNTTITVFDNTKPNIISVNGDYTPERNETCTLPGAPLMKATDNCAESIFPIDPLTPDFEGEENRTCPYRYDYKRVWYAEDDCGNFDEKVEIIHMVHTEGPSFDQYPEDDSWPCDEPEQPETIYVTDSCGKSLGVANFTETRVNSSLCDQNYTLTWTWVGIDECGLNETHVKTVFVYDIKEPTIHVPQGTEGQHENNPKIIHNQCYPSPPDPVTADDTCAEVELVNGTTKYPDLCLYRYTLHHLWNATDECGNVKHFSQWVQYTHDTQPTLYNANPPVDCVAAEDLEANCLPKAIVMYDCDEVKPPAVLKANDSCDVPLPVNYTVWRENGTCDNEYKLHRKWEAIDDCGVPRVIEQLVIVTDNHDPELHDVPADITVECGFEPKVPCVTATDNCHGVRVDFHEERIDDPYNPHCCNYTLVRTWTATDNCNRTAVSTQVVTVVDRIPPELHGIPADVCVECHEVPGWPEVFGHEAPLAKGFCVSDNAADGCTGAGLPTGFSIKFGTATVHFEPNSTFVSYADGTAKIVANAKSQSNEDLTVEIAFSDFAKEEERPGREMALASCISRDLEDQNNPAIISPQTWRFYDTVEGHVEDSAGNRITFANTQYAQYGKGANGRSVSWGVQFALSYTVGEAAAVLGLTGNSTGSGEVAADLSLCDLSVFGEFPELECGMETPVTNWSRIIPSGLCDNKYIEERCWQTVDLSGNKVQACQNITVKDSYAPQILNVPADKDGVCNVAEPYPPVEFHDNCTTEPWHTNNTEIINWKCNHTYQELRTWNSTDDCGNPSYEQQIITYEDTTLPVLHFNLDSTDDDFFELNDIVYPDDFAHCHLVPPAPQLDCQGTHCVWGTDNCAVVPVDYSQNRTNSTKCPKHRYRLHRVWKIEDACNNTDWEDQYIDVDDVIKPDIHGVPDDKNAYCTMVKPIAEQWPTTVYASDLCDDDVPVYNRQWIEDDLCIGNYTLVREWNATDDCGNLNQTYQRIKVRDIDAPYFKQTEFDSIVTDYITSLKDGKSYVSCETAFEQPDLPWYDDCWNNVAPNVTSGKNETIDDDAGNQDCANSYKVTWTWWAVDDCGLRDSVSVSFDVEDRTNPTLSGVPNDTTIQCHPGPENPPCVTASDQCAGVDLYYNQTKVEYPDVCDDRYDLIRTWRGVDGCGNPVERTQNITVIDTVKPDWDYQPPVTSPLYVNTQECDAVSYPRKPKANDTCATPQVTPDLKIISRGCRGNYTVQRFYEAEDDCGNTRQWNLTYEVRDTHAPTFVNPPEDTDNECYDVDEVPEVVARDNCVVCAAKKFTSGPNAGQDIPDSKECGKGLVSVLNTTNPAFRVVFIGQSEHLYKTCSGNYTLERTWEAEDDCGHITRHVQTITVRDNDAPEFNWTRWEEIKIEFLGVDGQKEWPCDAPPTQPELPYTDKCGNITYNKTEVVDNNGTQPNCGNSYFLIWTWTIEDDCGHVTERSITVPVTDRKKPTLEGVPDDQVQNCSDVPIPPCVTATDECPDVEIFYKEIHHETDECEENYRLERIWWTIDDCGNREDGEYNVTVYDRTPPRWIYMPEQEFEAPCHNIPDPDPPVAVDNCTTSLTPVMLGANNDPPGVIVPGSECDQRYVLRRDWYVDDECGNRNWYNITITVYDREPPILEDVPEAQDGTCDYVPAPADVRAFDNCTDFDSKPNNEGIPTMTETIDPRDDLPGNCSNDYDLTREWFIADDCGQNVSDTQVIRIRDQTPPTWSEPTLPEDGYYECHETIPISAYDDGDDDLGIVAVAGIHVKPAYFVATDATTNDATCNSAENGGFAVHLDIDGGRDFAFFSRNLDDPNAGAAEGHVTEVLIGDTWHAYIQGAVRNGADYFDLFVELTDLEIGSEFDRVVNMDMEEIDSAAFAAADRECQASLYPTTVNDAKWWFYRNVARAELRGIQNTNTEGVRITLTKQGIGAQIGAGANGREATGDGLSLKFKASGSGGNLADYHFTDVDGAIHINLATTTEPFYSSSDVVLPPCDESFEIVSDEVRTNLTCVHNYTLTRTWTITDCSGNSRNFSRVWEVRDTSKPQLHNVPADTSMPCDNVTEPPEVTASDNCTTEPEDLEVKFNEEYIPGTDCLMNYTLVRTWNVTDLCGHTTYAEQVIFVYDTVYPEWVEDEDELPQDVTYECNNVTDMIELHATDTCEESGIPDSSTTNDTVVVMQEVRVPSDVCEQNYQLIRTWNTTDHCLNSIYHMQNVSVRDTQPPLVANESVVCLIPTTVGVIAKIHDMTVNGKFFSAADECSNITITVTGCTSNQDDLLRPLLQDVDDTFTTDCYYDEETDSLLVRVASLDNIPEGRTYNVSGVATDDCGNESPLFRQLFTPNTLVDDSAEQAGFEFEEGECDPFEPAKCEGCPCEYLVENCQEEPNAGSSLALTGHTSNDMETVLTYTLTTQAGSPVPNRLVIGLPLDRVNVLRIDPEYVDVSINVGGGLPGAPPGGAEIEPAQFGPADSTYVSGVTWTLKPVASAPALDVQHFTITLAGKFSITNAASVPYVLNGELQGDQNPCTVSKAIGPNITSAQYVANLGSVSGRVIVDGALNFVSGSGLAHGLGEVVVELRNVTVPTANGIGSLVATAMTNSDGEYTFNSIDLGAADYRVYVVRDAGHFRASTKLSAYIVPILGNPDLTEEHPDYLGPSAAVDAAGSAEDLRFFIDDHAVVVKEPDHGRGKKDGDKTFYGTSRRVGFWKLQVAVAHGECYSSTDVSADSVNAWASTIAGLSDCFSTAEDVFDAVLDSGSDTLSKLKHSLAIAELNNAAGWGIGGFYQPLQPIFLDYSRWSCQASSAEVDRAIGAALADKITSSY